MKISVALLFLIAISIGCRSASAVELGGVEVHGFVSQGFLVGSKENNAISSDSGKGSFHYNEFGLNFTKQITDELHIGMQLFAQDRGSYGKDKITIDWGFADYHFKDWLGIRAGKIKNPIGLYGETLDVDLLRTFVVMPQTIYYDDMRDTYIATTGGEVYGSVPLGNAGNAAYRFLIGTVSPTTDDGTAMRLNSIFGRSLPGNPVVKIDEINAKTVYSSSLEWNTPVQGLRLQGSYYVAGIDGHADSNSSASPLQSFTWGLHDYTRRIASIEYTWQDLVLAGEYEWFDYTSVSSLSTPSKSKGEQWYVSASYRLTDKIEAGAYYTEYFDPDDRDGSLYHASTGLPAHNKYFKDTAMALKFDPVNNLALKLEGHLITGSNILDAQNYPTASKNSFLFATKVTISF